MQKRAPDVHFSPIIPEDFFHKSPFFRSKGNVIQQIKKVWPEFKFALHLQRLYFFLLETFHFKLCHYLVGILQT